MIYLLNIPRTPQEEYERVEDVVARLAKIATVGNARALEERLRYLTDGDPFILGNITVFAVYDVVTPPRVGPLVVEVPPAIEPVLARPAVVRTDIGAPVVAPVDHVESDAIGTAGRIGRPKVK